MTQDTDPIGPVPEPPYGNRNIPDAILRELIELDKSVNGAFGGDKEQTISARAYAVELAGVDSFWRVAIDRLFGEGHCRRAWEGEMEASVRAQQARFDW